MLADRFPAPQLLLVVLALGAAATLLVLVVDEPVLEAIVERDPGPRLNPLLAAVLLFGLPSVILATATPIAVRLRARSVVSVGQDRRAAVRRLDGREHRRHVHNGVLAHPRDRTNQLLGLLATALFVAAGLVALGEGKLVPGVVVAARRRLGGRRRWRSPPKPRALSRRPRTGHRSSWLRARQWTSARPGLRARLLQGHALPRPHRGRRRGGTAPSLRELVPERHVPR